MQPYFFPYAGYFCLLAAVDRFVFYDDVHYIKSGWINRNRLLLGGEPSYFTVPVVNASCSTRISDVAIVANGKWRRKMLESLRHGYSAAPHFGAVYELVQSVVFAKADSISELAKASVYAVAKYLEVDTHFVDSSSSYDNASLRGVERVLDICRREQATHYINLSGGRSLYEPECFRAAGLTLAFVDSKATPYPQFSVTFQPALSIVDLLMHNAPSQARSHIGAEKGQ